MAKKNTAVKTQKSKKREIFGIVLLVVSLFLAVALLSHDPGDWPGSSRAFDEPSNNLIGRYGALVSHYVFEAVGFTSYAVVMFMITAGIVILLHKKLRILFGPGLFLGVTGIFLPLLAALTVTIGEDNTRVEPAFRYGGILGGLVAHYMVTYLGRAGTYLIAIGSMLVSLVLTTNLKPSTAVEFLIAVIKPFVKMIAALLKLLFGGEKPSAKRTRRTVPETGDSIDDPLISEPEIPGDDDPFLTPVGDVEEENDAVVNSGVEEPEGIEPTINYKVPFETDSDEAEDFGDEDEYADIEKKLDTVPYTYVAPGSDLLALPEIEDHSESREEMLEQAKRIVESLRHFNIDAEVKQITPGPIVTRYEITLAPGIKVGRVTGLSNDLTMALRARGGIRIIAPIPGKAAIGIEVPNRSRSIVYFREIAESEAFVSADLPLVLAIGKNTSGDPVVADLAKMPHLLIAGSTGSGKSVCIHSILTSILMKASPYDVRIILVDPKVVELSIYSPIPHLLTPVITDTKRAASSLKWAVREMEARYRKLATFAVRDIYQYNKKADEILEAAAINEQEHGIDNEEEAVNKKSDLPEHMPFIVIVIDEFADLMVVAANDIEEPIARLAQMARAVGIHLILATQRPSADVITGLIKANFPSRIAFKVMQASNSRIILDEGGADKLLGMGDMLFLQAGKPEAFRMHGAYISNEECHRIVDFIATHSKGEPEKISEEMFMDDEGDFDNSLGLRNPNERDVLFYDAARLVVRHSQGSVSLLQRRLKIGYARAARLIDQLELAGIVTPYDGSKAREVLVDDMYVDQLEAGEL
ncbi:DNA translocase FtsK 4TM domain-containing protein [Candidatus Latescibacterota bacterium]